MRTAGLISKAEQVSVQPVSVAERSILSECLHACVAVSGGRVADESHVAPLEAFGRTVSKWRSAVSLLGKCQQPRNHKLSNVWRITFACLLSTKHNVALPSGLM